MLGALLLAPLVLALVLVVELLIARRGAGVPFEGPPRRAETYGSRRAGGPELVYAVLGDSTAVGQGGEYQQGIAVSTARHLSALRPVKLTNLAVAGAKTEDLLRDQVATAVRLRPDVVLVAVGANDVAQAVRPGRVRAHLVRIVDRLLAGNCEAKIVLTGSPDIGAVPRVAQPLRWVAGLLTERMNGVFESVAAERRLTVAPIARKTGPVMRADRTLFAADGFHPNDRGYATWVPVLARALDEALRYQPSHCM